MNELEIIIPAFNAHKTITKTIESICNQKNLPTYHVTIVNDHGKDYKGIIKKYKKRINIDEIETKENIGPGGSRQYGIDNSNSKFIIFIDADDIFYDNESVAKLYNKISKTSADLVISSFEYHRDNIIEIKRKNPIWLHGKIYKREFLEKNKIRFNNTRANEDNGFNSLLILLKPTIVISSDVTYVYKENPSSLTRRNDRAYKLNGMEGYAYNMSWAIEEAKKRGANPKDLAWKSTECLVAMYKTYNELYGDYDVNKLITWSKDLYNKYKEYQEYTNEYESQLLEDNKTNKEIISFAEFKEKIKKELN